MISIALPKGRLGDKVYKCFSEIGYACPEINDGSRKLVFEDAEHGVRYMLVKPSDVAVYVEHGAADIGVVGKDVLMETDPDIFELYDLQFGKCRMAVAAPNGWEDNTQLPLRVATKYPNIARGYYAGLNREIEIIKLNGSIELAPILGLSDVIVDIVETGSTLKENDLVVLENILPISARLVANKSAFKFKHDTIRDITAGLSAQVNARKAEKA
jgi:ATP phosphoribosyltransferase